MFRKTGGYCICFEQELYGFLAKYAYIHININHINESNKGAEIVRELSRGYSMIRNQQGQIKIQSEREREAHIAL
ncbi:hypothetical protein [Methylomusa anaerophila]|uniref:Uncharacterized protein n=1 Tax=Methylomusa anaerophila TaxID=1930071 RepID=A0A348AG31_9FIRM|nr:hypothetical protein [Methylomusa anaerophila]BBB90029.1 hypothetical protein MAMMFC1_00674 [Methylomusa anaerophila]